MKIYKKQSENPRQLTGEKGESSHFLSSTKVSPRRETLSIKFVESPVINVQYTKYTID